MLWFLVLAACLKIYIVPHQKINYSVEDMLKFDFANAREQLQMVIFTFAGLLTIYLYATSERQVSESEKFFPSEGERLTLIL
tara:strand:+ start:115 stop:360 length:246 start_codon:yes stop_codon:yes gene_type:complete